MRVACLTTQTTHHAFFVRSILNSANFVGSVIETSSVLPTFDTNHPYIQKQRDFELSELLGGEELPIDELGPCKFVEDINSRRTADALSNWNPDLIIAFGIRRIKPAFLSVFPGILLNLHGGDPEKYRGLDSHLWAIYHSDFDSLSITLHVVA